MSSRNAASIHPLESSHHFVTFALETSSALGQAAPDIVRVLGHHLCQTTGESHCREYLLQRLSIAIHRTNAATVLGTTGTYPAKEITSENNYSSVNVLLNDILIMKT